MDGLISIKESETVITEAETVSAETISLEAARESIENILKELNDYWASEGEDAQSFATGLKTNCETLKKIGDCNKRFAIAITNYAEAQNAQSKNEVTA